MKISSKNTHIRKRALIIATVGLLSLGCIVFALIVTNIFGWRNGLTSNTGIDLHPPTAEQKKAGSQVKQESLDTTNNKVNNQSDTPHAPTPQADGKKSTVEVSITANDQNGNIYQIRSQIDTPTNDGTCTLTLTKESSNVTKTAGVQALAKVSTCKGFDIPTSELSPGVWQMALNFENDTLTGSTSGTITVQ